MLGWKDLKPGIVVTDPGSASSYKTGDWRSSKPIRDSSKCIKCGLCYLYCPDGAVELNENGNYETNYYYCKGCGICAKECSRNVITMIVEEE
ncbi:MAG: 4Fe-4S binding protein [Halobacteriota archaeon]|nr:4Fe-4S binding protein [Halobacteriota archaeon]